MLFEVYFWLVPRPYHNIFAIKTGGKIDQRPHTFLLPVERLREEAK